MILYILDIEQFKESEYAKEIPKQKLHHQAGQYLLRFALGDEVYASAEFAVGERGKPYIVGYPIHYNLSHSGRYVVLVVSEYDVGVDVQECKPVRMKALAKRFFTRQEQDVIHACNSEEGNGRILQEQLFYEIWCRKESYGKYLGVGLNEQVLSTNVLCNQLVDSSNFTEERLVNEQNETGRLPNFEFHDIDMIKGYQLCICSRKGEHIEKIISVFDGL